MPGMDGYETTRRLRADPRLRGLPVIAITAHVLAADQQRGREIGMDDHIPKPFDQAAFATTLGRWLRLPAALSESRPTGEPQRPAHTPHGPWINPVEGLRRVGGNRPLYLALLGDFIECHTPSLGAFDPQVEGTPGHELARVAHVLRGSAPMLGIGGLGALAAAVDERLKRGERLDPVLTLQLRAALATTLDEAQAIRTLGAPGLDSVSGQPPVGRSGCGRQQPACCRRRG